VRIFDANGNISVNAIEFNAAIEFYRELAACGPAGYNYWRQARQTYLTGSSAMIFYSPYIIDDIAGLVADQQVLVEDLAEKTGFVSVIEGPDGTSASYGQVVSFAILKGQETEGAKQWIRFILSDGYERWLNMTPGGKTPVLRDMVRTWSKHEIFLHYEPGFAEGLASGLEKIERWGYRDGNSFPLISEIYGRKIVPQLIDKVLENKVAVDDAGNYLETRLRALE
jgi:multiple sugar transport system substrate-binding protein